MVRGHPLGFDLLNKLIELCHSKDLGSAAADGFAVILHQDDMILNRNSNAVISVRDGCRKNNSVGTRIKLAYFLDPLPTAGIPSLHSKVYPGPGPPVLFSGPVTYPYKHPYPSTVLGDLKGKE